MEEVKKIEDKADPVIQVDLLLELTKFLKITGADYSIRENVEDQCTNNC